MVAVGARSHTALRRAGNTGYAGWKFSNLVRQRNIGVFSFHVPVHREAQGVIEPWGREYDMFRPHSSQRRYHPPAPETVEWPAGPRNEKLLVEPTWSRARGNGAGRVG